MRTGLALLALTATLALGAAARAVTISVHPASSVLQVEEVLEVDLFVAGLGDGEAPSLDRWGLVLTFEGSLLGGVRVAFGSGLDVSGTGSFRGVGMDPGSVTLSEESLDPAEDLDAMQPGAFRLATILLEGFAPGVSELSVIGEDFRDVAGDPIPVEVVGSAVRVIPEPSPAALLLLGLAAFAASRRYGSQARVVRQVPSK